MENKLRLHESPTKSEVMQDSSKTAHYTKLGSAFAQRPLLSSSRPLGTNPAVASSSKRVADHANVPRGLHPSIESSDSPIRGISESDFVAETALHLHSPPAEKVQVQVPGRGRCRGRGRGRGRWCPQFPLGLREVPSGGQQIDPLIRLFCLLLLWLLRLL